MNWINVNDRLPEEDELVLAAVTGCDKKENIKWEDAYLLARFYPEEGWYLEDHWEATDFTIRWWMRLPEDVPGGNDVPDTNVGHIDTDRMNEIMHAEREGRLVILPVAVKQDIYVLSKHTKCICMGQIVGIKLNSFTTPMEWIEYKYEHPVFGETASYERIDDALGRKVFLTLAEAETALKALEEANG